MKKTIVALGIVIAMIDVVMAQEYKVARSSGTLHLRELSNVSIEGYSGKEIVFTSAGRGREADQRAVGLRAISSMGLEDNTGIGLSVVEKGENIEVNQLKKTDGPAVRIKVPNGVKIIYDHTSPYGKDFRVADFDGPLEVSTVHNDVIVSNASGPLQLKTVHGDLDVVLGATITNPASIMSVHGYVDVSLPPNAKVNLSISTQWGEIFVDPDFKIEVATEGSMRRYNDKLRGTLNGGGVHIDLGSTHSNVYLRKRQ